MATRKKTTKAEPVKTTAHKIWEKISDLDLELFALPDQTLDKHADPVFDISPDALHLLLKTDAALPQLEDKLRKVKWENGQELVAEQDAKFVVVKPQSVR